MSFRGWAKPAALYSWFAMVAMSIASILQTTGHAPGWLVDVNSFEGVLGVAVLGVALLALSILDDGEADS